LAKSFDDLEKRIIKTFGENIKDVVLGG